MRTELRLKESHGCIHMYMCLASCVYISNVYIYICIYIYIYIYTDVFFIYIYVCTQVHRGIPNFLQPAEASNQGHQALLSSKKGDLHQDLRVSTDGTDGFIDKRYIYIYNIYIYILYYI